MNYLITHRKVVESLITMLFFIASSGFTVVLHSCLMEETTCCPQASTGTTSASVPVSVEQSACCSTNIVGGLNTNPALIDKLQKTEQQKVGFAASAIIIASPNINAVATPNQLTSRVSLFASPSVEKYILNASFLI